MKQKKQDKATASITHGVSYNATNSGVTLTIEGAAFENLKEITRIFNKWDGTDYTPAEMAWRQIFTPCEVLMNLGAKRPDFGETLADAICDAFTEAPDVGELAEAFRAAGFAVAV